MKKVVEIIDIVDKVQIKDVNKCKIYVAYMKTNLGRECFYKLHSHFLPNVSDEKFIWDVLNDTDLWCSGGDFHKCGIFDSISKAIQFMHKENIEVYELDGISELSEWLSKYNK